ncbi:hypothetical protein PSQ20_18670 [Curvibacter sp. RS43]|uniref:hypothetical protein n=1 Tax=Curvibacter microcysteis TaxID=3026419 RepID=UPI00236074FF|nr:hypothetical protein [Curvibacter sp. RS43]MDD0812380.1 hypothetical protein [Curvibacter sp. RS43]
MRGIDTLTGSLFSFRKFDEFVPAFHPRRPLRKWVNQAPAKMDALFSRIYAKGSINPALSTTCTS